MSDTFSRKIDELFRRRAYAEALELCEQELADGKSTARSFVLIVKAQLYRDMGSFRTR